MRPSLLRGSSNSSIHSGVQLPSLNDRQNPSLPESSYFPESWNARSRGLARPNPWESDRGASPTGVPQKSFGSSIRMLLNPLGKWTGSPKGQDSGIQSPIDEPGSPKTPTRRTLRRSQSSTDPSSRPEKSRITYMGDEVEHIGQVRNVSPPAVPLLRRASTQDCGGSSSVSWLQQPAGQLPLSPGSAGMSPSTWITSSSATQLQVVESAKAFQISPSPHNKPKGGSALSRTALNMARSSIGLQPLEPLNDPVASQDPLKVASRLRVSATAPSGIAAGPISSLVQQVLRETAGAVPLEKLQNLEREGLLAQIPRTVNGDLASVGSILHERGECSPCAYWFKGICKYSVSCTYCHVLHEGQKSKRLRPSKQTRLRMRRWEAMQQSSNQEAEGEASDGPHEDEAPYQEEEAAGYLLNARGMASGALPSRQRSQELPQSQTDSFSLLKSSGEGDAGLMSMGYLSASLRPPPGLEGFAGLTSEEGWTVQHL